MPSMNLPSPSVSALPPAPHVLANGQYTALVSLSGTGTAWALDRALLAWSADPVQDLEGFFIYLRDRETGVFWSAGWKPVTSVSGARGERVPGGLRLSREAQGIASTLDIAVSAESAFELRRVTVKNLSGRRRHVEITSLAEVALDHPGAYRAHPVYSKLFLQTEFHEESRSLLVKRRARAAGEEHPWLVHALLGADVLEYETDRARFLGRGRGREAPLALAGEAPLSGTTGNVLDPVVCLRTTCVLEPGASACATFLLGAAPGREEALALATQLSSNESVTAVFARAAAWEEATFSSLGLSAEEGFRAGELAGAILAGYPGLGARPEVPARAHRLWQAQRLPIDPLVVADGYPIVGAPHAEFPVVLTSAPRVADGAGPPEEAFFSDPLQAANSFGGFAEESGEYVIRMPWEPGAGLRLPPRPWINVVANENFGFLVSETGAGMTWSRNSREHRITPWANDPVLDPHSEAFYIRDEETGAFWSALPGPAPGPGPYEVRHGFGYTRARHQSQGLTVETLLFTARSDPARVTRVRVRNRGKAPRRLSLHAFYRLVLGVLPEESARFVVTEWDPLSGALLARNTIAVDFAECMAFASAITSENPPHLTYTTDRSAYIGPHGTLASPAALRSGLPLDGCTGAGLDPCFAHSVVLSVPPGAEAEVAFLLGEGGSLEDVRGVLGRLGTLDDVFRAEQEARSFWTEGLSRLSIETPSPALDRVVNGWLPYQVLACRLWARSALYQSGGAFGYRDQLQDALSLLPFWPGRARAQILLHAAHQFVEGDVLHWWHPPQDRGIRTRFADDLLWLPYLTAQYVQATGDARVLEETAPYLVARALEPEEDEAFLLPEDSGTAGSVYEHCCRAIDRSLVVGKHGLPLFGSGDWNDGMNRVGRRGQGESVWMGFFLFAILGAFAPLCERRGDAERARRYRAHAKRLGRALETAGWDGDWYRRAYDDDGIPLGSHQSDECRIDALVQAWAVISGAAPPARARAALDAVEDHLVSEEDKLIRLLAPPFDRTPRDPGYIKGYVPGVRENGGQYTHAALWVVQALAELGRNDRAARLLEMLSPVSHTRTPEDVTRYGAEPYVVAADVYGAPPHVGRAGWTWYTGSAGWMLRVALESVLGVQVIEGRHLRLVPCVPDAWPGYTVRWRLPGDDTIYTIAARNPHHRGWGVAAATLDGHPVEIVEGAAMVPLRRDGGSHEVELILGAVRKETPAS